jgi:DNA-binding MarR family transcriptional regulator
MGLVRKYKDPTNMRRMIAELTPKGLSMVSQIKEILNDY